MDVLPPAEYVASLNRKRTMAGVLFYDQLGRVLLVEPTYKSDWEIPGGACEADEAPWVAASRELSEELGISQSVGRLLVIDYIPTRPDRPEGLAFIFDGGMITESALSNFAVDSAEIKSIGLYAEAEVAARVRAMMAKRIRAALAAVHEQKLMLCELGELQQVA